MSQVASTTGLPPTEIPGGIVLDAAGRPFFALGGSMTIYPDYDRAAAVVAMYNRATSLKTFAPFSAAVCRVLIGDGA